MRHKTNRELHEQLEDTGADMDSSGSSAAPCSPALFDAGVCFQSAASGLWYENKDAAGDISAVRVDGQMFVRQENKQITNS